MVSKLKAGVIGCGSIARRHIYGYLVSGRYEVVALADVVAGTMEEFDKDFVEYHDYNPTHYTDASKMLDKENLDVVSVCTWHGDHAPWTIAASGRGVSAVLCEKPMAEDLGHAKDMMNTCRANNTKLVIGHQRRFLPSYNKARQLITEGAIGEALLIRSRTGDGLHNQASHLMDMFRYLLGDIDCEWVIGNVERLTDKFERNIRVEDKAVGLFGFPNGSRAMVEADLDKKRTLYQGGIISGSEGMIELFPDRLRLLNASTDGKWKEMAPRGKFFKAQDSSFENLEGCSAQADELADWIEGKIDTHRGEATHGYKALEMVIAIHESARVHQQVMLPVQTRAQPIDVMVETGHLPVAFPGKYDIRSRPPKAFEIMGGMRSELAEGAKTRPANPDK